MSTSATKPSITIPAGNPPDEFVKRGVRWHRSIPLAPSRHGLPAAPLGRAATSDSFPEFSVRPAGRRH